VCLCVSVCMSVCVYVCQCVCKCNCMCLCLCLCMCARVSLSILVWMRVCRVCVCFCVWERERESEKVWERERKWERERESEKVWERERVIESESVFLRKAIYLKKICFSVNDNKTVAKGCLSTLQPTGYDVINFLQKGTSTSTRRTKWISFVYLISNLCISQKIYVKCLRIH